jgi:hypothetical protein
VTRRDGGRTLGAGNPPYCPLVSRKTAAPTSSEIFEQAPLETLVPKGTRSTSEPLSPLPKETWTPVMSSQLTDQAMVAGSVVIPWTIGSSINKSPLE